MDVASSLTHEPNQLQVTSPLHSIYNHDGHCSEQDKDHDPEQVENRSVVAAHKNGCRVGGVTLQPPDLGSKPLIFQEFIQQASGHSQLFVIGNKLAKPCNPHEKQAYEELSKDLIIGPFTPKYYGTMFQLHPGVRIRKAQQPNYFILLENLTANYKQPCVMDLKLGLKNYCSKVHTARTVLHRTIKCAATTAKTLGFRVSGIRVYRASKDQFIVRNNKDSRFGNRLTEKTLLRLMEYFLSDGIRTRVELIPKFTSKLLKLLDALEKQTKFDFLASSVLLIYEGAYQKNCNNQVDVRVIDFDHATIWHEGKATDYAGVKVGIRSILDMLKQCYTRSLRTQSYEDLNSMALSKLVGRSPKDDKKGQSIPSNNTVYLKRNHTFSCNN